MDTKKELDFYTSITQRRLSQSKDVYFTLKEHFDFDKIECIETGATQNLDDGCFGLYLAKVTESSGGVYHSVDIYDDIVNKSKLIFEKYLPNFKIQHHVSDSIDFLESYQGNPNLVHLDSWDLDLTNPIPAMLHCWLEFVAIKDKMPSGSIIIIDDNFLKNTWVDWNIIEDGKYTGEYQRIDITYDIVGKGSMVYHWCQKENNDWDLIEDNHKVGENIKIIIKKR